MARCDVFVTAGNENRQTSIGGRAKAREGWARLNTDNASKSDCSIKVSAEVVGQRNADGKPRLTCHNCAYRWVIGHYTHKLGNGREVEGYDNTGNHQNNTWHEGDDKLQECPTCHAPRQGIDTRKTCFTVELPEQIDEHCEVVIGAHGHSWGPILAMGAALCAIKGITEITQGKEEANEDLIGHGESALRFARETFASLDETAKGKEYANVILPGGVSLAKALICVEIVRRIAEQGEN